MVLRRGLAVVTVLVSTLIPVGHSVASAETLPPLKQAFFNEPLTAIEAFSLHTPGAPSQITTAIVDLVGSASNRATIRIAIYKAILSSVPTDVDVVIDALRTAAARGVTIKILADQKTKNSSANAFAALDSESNNVTVHYCNGGCYTGQSIMHNKFLLVDDTVWTTSQDEDVVLQMTSNWTWLQLDAHYWNSAMQVWGDNQLYNGYAAYFDGLYACGNVTPSHCTGYPTQAYSGATATLNTFPQQSGDPVKSEINNLACARLSGGGNPAIDIAVGTWDISTRGNELAAALDARQNCSTQVTTQIRIVIPATSAQRQNLINLGLAPHCSTGTDEDEDPNFQLGDSPYPAVHSKYMLISGVWNGASGDSRLVFTGSENFADNALTANDETWLRSWTVGSSDASNLEMYYEYEANFDRLFAESPLC